MTTARNPHDSPMAKAHSAYSAWDGTVLQRLESTEPVPALATRVHDALRAVILDPEFPCVASRSAMNEASYRFAMYDELCGEDATAGLARDLYAFVHEQDSIPGKFSTFIAAFDSPKAISVDEFEQLLWQQLARLHAVDTEPWDSSVTNDPNNPHFSFSFGGRAFFIVGLCPNGERWARTFPWPTLAFNAHFQFEALREAGQFERMQDVVRERDMELEGSLNPNLGNFGDHTDARQYSGRVAEPDWKCPVAFE